MRTPRIFQNQTLIEGSTIELDGTGSHHIATVLRLQANSPIIVFNGTGGEYHGEITTVKNKKVFVELRFFNEADRASPLHIHLGQVMAKGDRMDYALQKAVELGVSEITPLFSERCEVKLKGERLTKKMDQWRHLLISACEQSGLNIVPNLHLPVTLPEWTACTHADLKWILHTEGLPSNPFQLEEPPASLCFAVGPEGGFSESEVEAARENNFNCITLGPRVWRTETAPVVLLSLAQINWGDLRN